MNPQKPKLSKEYLIRLFARKEEAEQVKDVVENPIIKQAFAEVEADMIKALKALPFNDADGRDCIWREIRIIDGVQRKLQARINELKIINNNIEVENGRRAASSGE